MGEKRVKAGPDGSVVVVDTRTLADAQDDARQRIMAEAERQIAAAYPVGWDEAGALQRGLMVLNAKLAGPLSADLLALEAALNALNATILGIRTAEGVALAQIAAATTNAAADQVTL